MDLGASWSWAGGSGLSTRAGSGRSLRRTMDIKPLGPQILANNFSGQICQKKKLQNISFVPFLRSTGIINNLQWDISGEGPPHDRVIPDLPRLVLLQGSLLDYAHPLRSNVEN